MICSGWLYGCGRLSGKWKYLTRGERIVVLGFEAGLVQIGVVGEVCVFGVRFVIKHVTRCMIPSQALGSRLHDETGSLPL